MEDAFVVLIWLFAEVIFFRFFYYSGCICLKVLSFGRLIIEPHRRKWNERNEGKDSYDLTDVQTAVIGFFVWLLAVVGIMFILEGKS